MKEELAANPELQSLAYFAKSVKKRIKRDWDLIICITGERGVGKSTLSNWLGLLIDDKFTLKDSVAYLPTEQGLVKKFNELSEYSYFSIDEAVRALYKMQFMNRLQQMITQMYNTERYQNKVTGLCIPRFRDLTEGFRNHLVRVWINVITRGVAVAYVIDDDKDVKDPWHLEENFKIKKKMYRAVPVTKRTIEQKIEIERRLINYMGEFYFPDMAEPYKSQYIQYRAESRREIKKQLLHDMTITKREQKYRAAIGCLGYALTKIDPQFKFQSFCHKYRFPLSFAMLLNHSRRWARDHDLEFLNDTD